MMITREQIDSMSVDELYSYLETRICAEDGCNNRPAEGYVLCDVCLYGSPIRASDLAIYGKERLLKLVESETK